MTPGAQERLRFWFANAELAAMSLQKVAPDGDSSNLVVLVADLRDAVARSIVEAVSESQGFDVTAHEAKIEKKGEIPTAILILKIASVERIMDALDHPGIAKSLSRIPPPGHLRALIISSGAAMLLHPPVTPIAPAGQG